MEPVMRKLLKRIRTFSSVFYTVLAPGKFFYRADCCNENVLQRAFAPFMEYVINDCILRCTIDRHNKIRPCLLLAEVYGFCFPADVLKLQCPNVTAP